MAKTKRKQRGTGHERHPEILDAALKIFAKEGLEKMTMRRVASDVGLSTTSLYIYFKNKEDILNALRSRSLADLHSFAQTAYNGRETPREKLRCHLRAYIDYAQENADSYRLTFPSLLVQTPAPSSKTTEKEAKAQADFNVLVSEMEALIPESTANRTELAHSLAETSWAMVHGISSLVIDLPNFPLSGIDTCFDQTMTMIMAGIDEIIQAK